MQKALAPEFSIRPDADGTAPIALAFNIFFTPERV